MHSLLTLKKYLKRYKWHIVFGIIALIIIDFLQLVIPQVLRRAIDTLAAGKAALSLLAFYFLIILLLALGIAVGRFFWRYLIIGSSRRIERALRTDFYAHLLTLDFAYFDSHKTGDLMAHAVNDINAVRMAIGFGMIILVDIVIMGIAAFAIMLSLSVKLTLFVLIPLPVIAVVSTLFGRLIHRRFEKVQEAFATLTERVRESLSGIKVIKVFVQERGEIQKFDVFSRDYIEKNVRLIRVWGLFWPLIMFLAALGEVIVLWRGGMAVIFGEVSIGSFVAFIAYLQMLVWPMIAIGWAINLFQRGAASQARLNKIFSQKSRIKGGSMTLEHIEGGIEFRNITFTFQDKEQPVLKNISLTIKPREFIGVTGPIGSGKTSIVNLIMRLYEQQEGDIFIDGHNIRDLNTDNLRTAIAYVPQDTFLFADTIRENILFGNGHDRAEDIIRVTKIAGIHDEIMAFPRGFDTRIGERGVMLSGGQKQRIALARALLLQRPILILDDAVSSVDAETERDILRAISQDIRARTSIVISHRVFVLRDASRIVVLDKGEIVETGTHEELLERRGTYRNMYDIQQIEMKLEEK
jgi:ATP-binding cassette subfamily B multidrug efflux pump